MTTVYFCESIHINVRFVRSKACFWVIWGGSRLFVHVVHGCAQGHGAAKLLPFEGRQVSRADRFPGLSAAADSGCGGDRGRLVGARAVI